MNWRAGSLLFCGGEVGFEENWDGPWKGLKERISARGRGGGGGEGKREEEKFFVVFCQQSFCCHFVFQKIGQSFRVT